MRLDTLENGQTADASASRFEASWSSSEILLVAAGGLAMLLMVGVLDALKLLA